MSELLAEGREGSGSESRLSARLPSVSAAAPLGEQLYRILEDAIIKGDLAPGEPLNDRELIAHFGVSRIPYRDALQALEKAGWIEKIGPRQGMRVRPLSDSELVSIVEVRQVLDGECAALAATRRTPDQLEALERIAVRARSALEREDRTELVSLNAEFHAMVAQCTQNEVYQEILSTLEKRVRRFLWAATLATLQASATEHENLVEAIRAGDSDAARAIAIGHAARHPAPDTARPPGQERP